MNLVRALGCLLLLLALVAPTSFAADHATAFLYHRFGDDRFPATNVTLDDFRAHLDALRDGGYSVVTLGEVVSRLVSGEPLPEKAVALSVDDVYRSFLEGALPLLRAYGYRATLFVASGTVGGDEFLTWDELAGLAGEGFEIGNHSARHDYLLDRTAGEDDAAWERRLKEELAASQAVFATQLGAAPELFAYPYGEFDPQLVDLIRQAGFHAAFGQQSGVIAADGDLFTLPRFPMAGAYASIESFRDKLRMRPLPVDVLAPETPFLVGADNPPGLRVRVALDGLAASSLRCYVNGREGCRVVPAEGEDDIFVVRADQPLEGRRNKYTLTARGTQGGWFWFSYSWVSPRR